MFSIYSVFFNVQKMGFDWKGAIDNWTRFLNQSDQRTTSVPLHGRREIGVGLLRKILQDIEITTEEFRRKL